MLRYQGGARCTQHRGRRSRRYTPACLNRPQLRRAATLHGPPAFTQGCPWGAPISPYGRGITVKSAFRLEPWSTNPTSPSWKRRRRKEREERTRYPPPPTPLPQEERKAPERRGGRSGEAPPRGRRQFNWRRPRGDSSSAALRRFAPLNLHRPRPLGPPRSCFYFV